MTRIDQILNRIDELEHHMNNNFRRMTPDQIESMHKHIYYLQVKLGKMELEQKWHDLNMPDKKVSNIILLSL